MYAATDYNISCDMFDDFRVLPQDVKFLPYDSPRMRIKPMFDLHYTNFNHQDFLLFRGCEENDKWQQQNSRIKENLPHRVIKERQIRRNERERARQNRLNEAFDVLRNTIPEFLTPYKKGQKLTQIETLRLAKHYIGSLKDILNNDNDITIKTEQ